ncbi:TetR/AcrR family transcriptional regulator [Microvirga sp. CF3062]|uniref:TetR/AcrR family transcriptional regulator n=1 Tax=Microvirga sp. CF3062 TaxID=3110182 RepID=UPI002E7702DE|nr:TetR/AcrR family transcriptional regulator [Microvirga sp. CF3062]MEE1656054.1 TetR/AcrR family transcriptional regulator [Microvirga sp. CF3062]
MTPTSNALPRQTKRYEQKRQAILDGAVQLFNQKGLKGTTLADVAQSVGLITNSVTYYYRKKEELATACLLRSIEALDALIATALQRETPDERLRAILRLYCERLAESASGDRPPLMSFSDMRSLTSPHVELVFDTYNQMFRHLRSLYDLDGAPALSRAQKNARAHLLISVMHGVRHWIDHYEPQDYRRVADRISDILIHGLAGPQSAWRPTVLPQMTWPSVEEVSPEAFLRSATILINEQGYRGASVEKISARLNVTKGSFYHHNDNKDDLVTACFERTFAVVRQVQQAAESDGETGWDRLCAATSELIRYQLSDQGPLLRISAFSALPEGLRGETKRTIDRLAQRFGSFVVDGMVDGSIRPLDPFVAAHMVDSAINAAVELERWISGVTRETAAEIYARPLFIGIFSPEVEAQPASMTRNAVISARG